MLKENYRYQVIQVVKVKDKVNRGIHIKKHYFAHQLSKTTVLI
jgi:hypothetical protein